MIMYNVGDIVTCDQTSGEDGGAGWSQGRSFIVTKIKLCSDGKYCYFGGMGIAGVYDYALLQETKEWDDDENNWI